MRNFKFELGDTVTDFITYDYNSLESIGEDCSGNNYNLTMTGNLTYNEDSPRYEGSTTFDGNSYLQTKTGSMV